MQHSGIESSLDAPIYGKPRQISFALILLYLSLLVQVMLLIQSTASSVGGGELTGKLKIQLISQLLAIVLNWFLLVMISQGRNWARILLLILSLLVLPLLASHFANLLHGQMYLVAGFQIAFLMVPVIGLLLMFRKKSSAWFATVKKKNKQSGVKQAMSIQDLLFKFFLNYFGIYFVALVIQAKFNLIVGAVLGVVVLSICISWACDAFSKLNGRFLSQAEMLVAIAGMFAIVMSLQVLIGLKLYLSPPISYSMAKFELLMLVTAVISLLVIIFSVYRMKSLVMRSHRPTQADRRGSGAISTFKKISLTIIIVAIGVAVMMIYSHAILHPNQVSHKTISYSVAKPDSTTSKPDPAQN